MLGAASHQSLQNLFRPTVQESHRRVYHQVLHTKSVYAVLIGLDRELPPAVHFRPGERPERNTT